MLRIKDLHVHYGGIHAIKGISLEVPRGKVVTLIGANGAGKSSTLRAIAGIVTVAAGIALQLGDAGLGGGELLFDLNKWAA